MHSGRVAPYAPGSVSPPDISPGKRLGPFELVRPLGRGGFAPVWLAREIHDGVFLREVALKLFAFTPGLASDASPEELAEARRRIIEEARALCLVTHPFVVRFYSLELAASQGLLGLAMEVAEGRSLDVALTQRGRLSVAETLAVGLMVASALSAVHGASVVHRDVKPANVVESAGSYKLIDFGIALPARPRRPGAPGAVAHYPDLPPEAVGTAQSQLGGYLERETSAGASFPRLAGTVGYLDPVCMAQFEPATAASDLYALGAMLFQCLTGKLPAAAEAPPGVGLLGEVLDGRRRAPRVRDVVAEIPAELGALVDRLLSPGRAERPGSAEEVVLALEAIQRGFLRLPSSLTRTPEPPEPAAAPPTPPKRQERLSRWGVGLALLATLGLGLGLGSLRGLRGEDPKPAPLEPMPSPRPPPLPSPLPECPAEMVAIRGGSYVIGTNAKWEGDMDERPAHGVRLDGFCLDRTEVTVETYDRCAQAKACPEAPRTVRHEDGDRGGEARDSRYCNGGVAGREQHPINCVDWHMAEACCRFLGKRLPTETEWEVAARGAERRKYPFPERLALGPTLFNVLDRRARERIGKPTWPVLLETDDGFETTAPVGSYPEGATPEGLLDMAGNVWEWVADGYGAYPDSSEELVSPKGPPDGPGAPRKVLRGGGFLVSNPSMIRAAQRNANPPYLRSQDAGFRCAKDGGAG